MALPAFKDGKPLFKDGKPCFATGPCTCGGGCTCGTLTATTCSVCPTSCTPRYVEAVMSGVATACFSVANNRTVDANGATLGGTFTAEVSAACQWQFVQSPGSTFNFRLYTGTTCVGSPLANRAWHLDVSVRDPGGGAAKKVRATVTVSTVGGGFDTFFFDGEVDMPSACAGTIVINNGDGGLATNGGTGGTITLHFCP